LKLAAGDPHGAATELQALGPPGGDPAGEAGEHLAAALVHIALGADPHPAFEQAVAAAEAAGDPTLIAEILLEALGFAAARGEELASHPALVGSWREKLARAARATDAPPIARALRGFELGARSEDPEPDPPVLTDLPPVRPYRTALRAFDRELFRAALARAGGQVPAAARLLRLPESTFRYRAARAGVLRPRAPEPKPDP
jgi:hypothetical protein